MSKERHEEKLSQLKADFSHVVETYNSAVRTGKVRTIRPAAVAAHHAVYAVAEEVRKSHPEQIAFLSEVDAAFMNVRFGNLIG